MPEHYTILLVEDSPEDRYFFRRILEMRPGTTYRVIEAETCEEGIELAHRCHPDCVLLDYILPDMEGFYFLQALQSEGGLPSRAVVVLTGLEELPLATTLPDFGATALLSKQRAKLPTTVYHAIDGSMLSFRHLLSGTLDSPALVSHWQQVHMFGYRLGALSAAGAMPREARTYLTALEHQRQRIEREAIALLHQETLSEPFRNVLEKNQEQIEALISKARDLVGDGWWPLIMSGSPSS